MQQLPESQSPYQNTTSFIARLIQAAVSKQDPQLRLAMLTSLWVDIRTMENMYGLNASELAMLRDEIGHAFNQVNNPDIALIAALSIDLFQQQDFEFRNSTSFESLGPAHKMHIIRRQVMTRINQLQQQSLSEAC